MRWLLLAMAWVSACGEPSDDDERCGPKSGHVRRVLDGDTVELESGVKIRYLLVDTPEISHSSSEVADCFGDEAKAYNLSLVSGRDVSLAYDTECEDRFGRTLAYVSLDSVMVNRVLIEQGYARVLVIEPNHQYADEFRALQDDAEARHAGLWGACE